MLFTVASAVACKKLHVTSDVKLSVGLLKAAPPPPLITEHIDTRRLLFSLLPVGEQTDSREDLKYYINSVCGPDILFIAIGDRDDAALVTFAGSPGLCRTDPTYSAYYV